MKYPKAFEEWYKKFKVPESSVAVFNLYTQGVYKEIAFEGRKAAAKKVDRKIGFYNRIFDHHWQHEDVDSLHEFTKELYK